MNKKEKEPYVPGRPGNDGPLLKISVGEGALLLAANHSARPWNVGEDKRGTSPVPRFFVPISLNRNFSHVMANMHGQKQN
jgi:hypothetical protein